MHPDTSSPVFIVVCLDDSWRTHASYALNGVVIPALTHREALRKRLNALADMKCADGKEFVVVDQSSGFTIKFTVNVPDSPFTITQV